MRSVVCAFRWRFESKQTKTKRKTEPFPTFVRITSTWTVRSDSAAGAGVSVFWFLCDELREMNAYCAQCRSCEIDRGDTRRDRERIINQRVAYTATSSQTYSALERLRQYCTRRLDGSVYNKTRIVYDKLADKLFQWYDLLTTLW